MSDLFPGLQRGTRGTAVLSPDGRFRYQLTRDLLLPINTPKPADREGLDPTRRCVFLMLNPSTADGNAPDNTIGRCMGFARREGCAHLTVVNLYAFRTRWPHELWPVPDRVGPDNERAIRGAMDGAYRIICGWGNHAEPDRVAWVREHLVPAYALKCLGKTKHGQPTHPLYIRADAPLERWP